MRFSEILHKVGVSHSLSLGAGVAEPAAWAGSEQQVSPASWSLFH